MTKERLRHYRDIKRETAQIRSTLQELEASMTSPRAQALDGMPRSGSQAYDHLADVVAKHQDLVDQYCAKLDELAAEQMQIEQAIESLQPRERELIRYRYIEGLSWEEICVRMSYSWRQTHRIHANALQQIKDK